MGNENNAGPEISFNCDAIKGNFRSSRAVCSGGGNLVKLGSMKNPIKSVSSQACRSARFLVICRSPEITAHPPSAPSAGIHSTSLADCGNLSLSGIAKSPSSNKCPMALATFGETLLSNSSFKPQASPQRILRIEQHVRRSRNRERSP